MNQEYIPVKKSQITVFHNTPLYYVSKDNEPLLYKQEGAKMDDKRVASDQHPDLFIHISDKDKASKELYKFMTENLAEAIFSKGIVTVRGALAGIVNEALTGPLDTTMAMLPETLDVMFEGYSKDYSLLDSLSKISSHSSKIVEHTVNVLSLTLQYCFFHRFTEMDCKQLGVSAILHDIGCTQIDLDIVESDVRLSDDQYEVFRTHTTRGYNMIKSSVNYGKEISLVALEHHEKLDGSGYPTGKKNISEASQLIGLICSYEPLTYRSTRDRQAQRAFNSLQLLKNEVLEGQYDKNMFRNFCSCLIR